MTGFAKHTSVDVYRTKAEIEKVITRYGATQFIQGWEDETGILKAVVQFKMNDRYIKFVIDMPSKNDSRFHLTPGRKTKRSPDHAFKSWEQSIRQKFRALLLVIKAKLESVESGISEFESEFLAHILLPDGKTVGQHMIPQIAESYKNKKMPLMLPDLRGNQ